MLVPGVHYDPDQTTTYMAEKTSVRLLLALCAAKNWVIEHFDITSAYLHERYTHSTPVFVQQPCRFNGSPKHTGKAGSLIISLYGTPPAAHIYYTGLTSHFISKGYTISHADPALFQKISQRGSTLVAISMDDVLATAPTTDLLTELYGDLALKYTIKMPRFSHGLLARERTEAF